MLSPSVSYKQYIPKSKKQAVLCSDNLLSNAQLVLFILILTPKQVGSTPVLSGETHLQGRIVSLNFLFNS